jgi:hypothetical protein
LGKWLRQRTADADIRMPIILSLSGLAFSLFALERFPSLVTAIAVGR